MTIYIINLFKSQVKIKSAAPKNSATAREIPMTIKVCLMVSSLDGQVTFFISSRTSLRKLAIREKNDNAVVIPRAKPEGSRDITATAGLLRRFAPRNDDLLILFAWARSHDFALFAGEVFKTPSRGLICS